MLLIALLLSAALASAQIPEDVQPSAASSLSKIRQDDRPQTSNLVWTQRTKTIRVAGAKNEHIPFQLILTVAPPGRTECIYPSSFFDPTDNVRSADPKDGRASGWWSMKDC